VDIATNTSGDESEVARLKAETLRLTSELSRCEQALTAMEESYRQKTDMLKALIDDNEAQKNRLITAKNEAEEANKGKSRFLATMSHEIRTPLNAIIGITQIQLQNEGLPEEYAIAMDKISRSGNSLLGIINDILDMSKIETGNLELTPAEYCTPNLINDSVQLNIVRIGAKPIEFVLEIDENLPARLYGDELRLKQILNNLLSNAIKYTDDGFVKFTVSHFDAGSIDGAALTLDAADIDADDIFLRFAVEDTGQGMLSKDRARLFSAEYLRFNAAANRAAEGVGLGLGITKRLVEMMDGDIKVESKYGLGSKFTVTVRQKAVGGNAIGAELAGRLRRFDFIREGTDAKQQIIRVPMPYGKVLVVDDVGSNLYVAAGLLAPYRLKVETLSNGVDAIDRIRDGSTYDVIFMDHMMPHMDGIEVTKELREMGYGGAIVALTANALVGSDEMFRRNGFDGYISKPIDIRHLDETLRKFVRDRYPIEALKWESEAVDVAVDTVSELQPLKLKSRLARAFCRDARSVVAVMREATADGGGVKKFTINAHAIKSALANIGETMLSESALALEKAGLGIMDNTENFTRALEELVEKLVHTAGDAADCDGEMGFLAEQLQVIMAAAENYDIDDATAAIDRLEEKRWPPETGEALDEIGNMLLHSEFDEAAEKVKALFGALQNCRG